MELRVLKYFLAIAREESISHAAQLLHVTQPTLSRQMKELEDEIGKILFIRGNRKITLTNDGMLLRKRAEEIVNLVEKTEIEMMSTEESLHGEIHIGAAETQCMRYIAKAMHAMQKDYPLVKFHLYSGNAQDVNERIDKGLIDFGVLIEPTSISKYDFLRFPEKDVWGVLMRDDAPLASKSWITPSDLKDVPVLCSNQQLVTGSISGWLGNDFKSLNVKSYYNLIYNASLVVDESCAYALTLDGLISCDSGQFAFRPLEPRLEVGIVFVWKKYQFLSKPCELFLDYVEKEMAKVSA